MDYQEAVDYILQIPKFTSKKELGETISFLEYLGNPQDKLKVIHVAGTNGKGSVCFYLDNLLQSETRRVGRFTSPHLERINERIVINGEDIRDEDFLDAFLRVKSVVENMQKKGESHPTFFEFIFGMALLAFVEAKVEYCVLETGLGGRLDATNAVKAPIMTVITSIGYDHMEQLGNTLAKIASEKGGIIKEGVPLVFASTTKESDEVIERRAKHLNSPFIKVTKDDFKIIKQENNGIVFFINKSYYGEEAWFLGNIGIYQVHNVLLALEVMRVLFCVNDLLPNTVNEEEVNRLYQYSVAKAQLEKWKKVLGKVVWPGRMEEVRPNLYLDGAHNATAILSFVQSVVLENSLKTIVFGAVADKDIASMIRELVEGLKEANVEKYIVTNVRAERKVEAKTLGDIFGQYTKKPVIVIENPREAVDYAVEHQGEGKVYCLGSLYLIGELRGYLKQGNTILSVAQGSRIVFNNS